MVKFVLELILAFALLFSPSSGATEPEVSEASLPAEETVLPAAEENAVLAAYEPEVYSHQSEGVMLARFQNILNHNHCFGDDINSPSELIFSAQVSLLSECRDGYIASDLVDNFVFNMYGKRPEGVVFDFSEQREGYYPVIPRGFSTYSHTVTDYSYLGDGRIEVFSDVLINETEMARCESILFADGTSAFGYILLSCEIYY